MEWNGSSWSGGTIWSVRPPISEQQPRQPQQPQPQPQPQQPQQQEVVQGGEPPGDHTCLIAARFGGSEDAVPEAFVCSITQRVMLDPVVAADGHTYDRAAILRWFAQGHSQLKSPLSGELLRTTELLPNNNLRSQIQNFSTTTDNGAHGSAAEFDALERKAAEQSAIVSELLSDRRAMVAELDARSACEAQLRELRQLQAAQDAAMSKLRTQGALQKLVADEADAKHLAATTAQRQELTVSAQAIQQQERTIARMRIEMARQADELLATRAAAASQSNVLSEVQEEAVLLRAQLTHRAPALAGADGLELTKAHVQAGGAGADAAGPPRKFATKEVATDAGSPRSGAASGVPSPLPSSAQIPHERAGGGDGDASEEATTKSMSVTEPPPGGAGGDNDSGSGSGSAVASNGAGAGGDSGSIEDEVMAPA